MELGVKPDINTVQTLETEENQKQKSELIPKGSEQLVSKIAVNDQHKFFTVEEETRTLTREAITEYMRRVAFTVYGNKVLKMENYTLGMA